MGMTPVEESNPVEADDDRPVEADSVSLVKVEGRETVVVSPSSLEEFPTAEQRCTVKCSSGEHETDTWTGVPVGALVEAADVPGETTHLRFEADDFTVDVSIRTALDAVLAFEREAEPGKLPRLISGDIPGDRLVKRVRRISGVVLDPEDDPVVD